MANKVDALINVKDASGVLNEIYPITKKENVQGLAEFISNSLAGYSKKTDLDGYSPKSHSHDDRYYTEDEINTKLGSYLPKSGGTLTGVLTLKGAPTADLQAATKKYVDDSAMNIKPKAHEVTLTVAGWDSATKAQTVNANGVTTTNIVTVSPATKASADIWAESEVFCAEQGDGTLKFTCTDVPTSDITVSVVIIG